MTIHHEGRKLLIISLLVLIALIIYLLLSPLMPVFKLIILLPFLIVFALFAWFFRVPARTCNLSDNIVYAPADGKIVVIEKTTESEYFNDERIQISIFMSPLNVHQNTFPVSGDVTYTKYHQGDYLVAWHPKSSTQNERSTVVIRRNDGTEILVRQIAGAVARRICTYVKKGDNAEQGEEFGFIKFGSRVDVFLPLNSKIECALNQTAKNKLTILAKV